MSQAPAMPMFVDAMLGDTLHLDAELFGAYHLLLYATWRANGQPLVNDDAVLARVCRMPLPRWRKLRPVLAAFFDVSDGTWRQKRLEQEWRRVQERAGRARENGARGGRPATVEGKPAIPPSGKPKPDPRKNPAGNPEANPEGNPDESSHIHIQKEDTPPPPDKDAARAGEDRRGEDGPAALIRVLDDAVSEHFQIPRPGHHHQDAAIAQGWIERGVTVEFARGVIDTIVGRRAAEGQDAPQSLKFFLNPMVRALAAAGPVLAQVQPVDPQQEARHAKFNAAVRAWSDDGRQGPAPRLEDFGLPAMDAGKAA